MLIRLSTWSGLRSEGVKRHSIKIDNNSFEMVEEFEYLGTTLTIKIIISKKVRAY